MASRLSGVSSISSVSSIGRRNVDFEGFQHIPAATVSTHHAERSMGDQRDAAKEANETVVAEPLLPRSDLGQPEEYVGDYETKGPIQTHQAHYGTRSWYYDWWFWEITGALLGLGSTVAIVVMLAVCNDKPMPVLRYGITLNAMLSVLSTIAKVCPFVTCHFLRMNHLAHQNSDIGQTSMLLAATESIGQAKWLLFRKQNRNLADFKTIDEASRGPWGAFLLLYRFWDGRTILASAGAFIVLASLAVDPFTQQILSYPSISNVTSGYQQPALPTVAAWNTSGNLTVWESADSDPSRFFVPVILIMRSTDRDKHPQYH